MIIYSSIKFKNIKRLYFLLKFFIKNIELKLKNNCLNYLFHWDNLSIKTEEKTGQISYKNLWWIKMFNVNLLFSSVY